MSGVRKSGCGLRVVISLVDMSEKVDGLGLMKGAMVVECTGRIRKR